MKYKSLHAMSNLVSVAIDKNKLNRALRIIHDVVECIITEPLCTGQGNGSKVLDELCQKIGDRNFSALLKEDAGIKISQDPQQSMFTYVVTKLQKSGGHSLVIQNFIKARPNANHIILSTELNGSSDFNHLIATLDSNIAIGVESAPGGDFLKKLTWLQKRLIEIRPEQTYLFNHPQDSVAVAAIQPGMALNASFYHHADHHLCLGVFLSHLKHIDIHSTGYHYCRESLGINNSYLPLIVDDKGDRSSEFLFKEKGYLTTCTAARSNKIESPYFINYLNLIPQLLNTTKGKHIHIGRLTPIALLKLRWELKRQKISPDRFIYIPWVPSVWSALQEYGVDLYIASFPYGGGLTLIEAMGAGVPVSLHQHLYSKVLSGIDLAHEEVFSWRYPEELFDYCTSLTPEILQKQGQLGRYHYEKFNQRKRLDDIINGNSIDNCIPITVGEKYQIQSDEWACWIENQRTFSKLVVRLTYRLLKRARRMYSDFIR